METPEEIPPSPTSSPPPASLLRRAGAGLGFLLIGLIHLLPIVLALLCGVWGTRFAVNAWHLSLWLAVPFGLLVGAAFLGLIAQGGTLFDAGVRCAVIAIIGLLLWPVFFHARERARLAKQNAAKQNEARQNAMKERAREMSGPARLGGDPPGTKKLKTGESEPEK